jgi:chemotaxis protein methyltransferase CheR
MTIGADDFEFVRTLVQLHAGIILEPGKEYLVESRLRLLAEREGLPSIPELIGRLRGGRDEGLNQKVVEAMATNETMFFRDVEPFEVLRKFVLPELIEANRPARRLHIWYAGCSTGQEPYSVSMLIHEHFPELLSWDLQQLAIDISPSALARAREGRYGQVEVNRGLPATYLASYFSKQGNTWQVKDAIRQMVRFEELNLIRPWPALPSMDIVMLRNVMIYFDINAKKQILSGIRRILRPNGFLFLGGAETTMNLDDGYVRQQYERAGCYRQKVVAAA